MPEKKHKDGHAIENRQQQVTPEPEKYIRMLVWGDSPTVATGFGTVIRGIFTHLANTQRYLIDIIGINDRGGWHDPEEFPFRIYPAYSIGNQDYYGRHRFVMVLTGKDKDIKMPYDIVFTLNDPFILEQSLVSSGLGTIALIKSLEDRYQREMKPRVWFKTVSYWPIDSPIKDNWLEKSIALPDQSIAYTEYAKEEILKAESHLQNKTEIEKRLSVIYHGVDLDTYKPLPLEEKKAFRQEYYSGKVHEDTFLIGIVARNQMRKDIPRAMKIFREFLKRRPNSFLYIHAKETDSWGSLREYARQFGLREGDEWGFPANFDENTGYPLEAMNAIYNTFDCTFSTTLGEGFGMPIVEAMAINLPVIAPNHTSITEIFGVPKGKIDSMDTLDLTKVRGIPLNNGTTASEWATYGPNDFERFRPLTNIEDAVKKLIWVYDNPEKAKQIAQNGHDWVQQYSWKAIAQKWDEVFTKVYNDLEKERAEWTPPEKKEEVKSDGNAKV